MQRHHLSCKSLSFTAPHGETNTRCRAYAEAETRDADKYYPGLARTESALRRSAARAQNGADSVADSNTNTFLADNADTPACV